MFWNGKTCEHFSMHWQRENFNYEQITLCLGRDFEPITSESQKHPRPRKFIDTYMVNFVVNGVRIDIFFTTWSDFHTQMYLIQPELVPLLHKKNLLI